MNLLSPRPRPRHWLLACLALIGLAVANPVTARDREIDLQGLLAQDELTAKKMERRVLKSGMKDAHRYRILSGLYVLRAPTLEFWEDQIGPALEDAMDADRPVEALRGTLLGMDEYLIAGPDQSAVRIRWATPGDRGEGFVNFVAPVLIGPDGGLTSHTEPNKFKVVTGWFVDEADGDPVIEAVGLKSSPDAWTGGEVRFPKLVPLPKGGEGAWVKYKGRSVDETGDEMAKSIRSVERLASRDYIAADRALPWPRESGESIKDFMTSARYRTKTAEMEPGEALKLLRADEVADWDWEKKKVKHPTRYGISTVTVNAETEKGDEVGEVFAFVYFYTSLLVSFDAAHLYVGTSPEFFATAVQQGEIPFFDAEGTPRFYLGHLDRWISGEALKPNERAISRRIIEKTADRWTRDMNGNDARSVTGLAKNPNHWPLRVVANEDDEDRLFKVMAYKDDLVSWWRRFENSLRPEGMDWFDPVYTLTYSGEAAAVDVGVLFGGETRELEMDSGDAVADEENDQARKLAERENASLSAKEKARVDQERREADADRSASEKKRAEQDRERDEARQAEQKRKADEERRREEARIAQESAPIDVRLLDVLVGSRTEGKPYLATRAGKSQAIKVKYEVEGKVEGHKVQIVAQAYDRSGKSIPDFSVKSTSKTPSVGENETTTWLKVPSSYTTPETMGSYRVLTRLELDGVPLRGEREEFVHVGSALALRGAELDPSVVLPGEEAVLLMDLEVGGWSVEDDVPLQVDLVYSVGGESAADTFNMTRGIGFHELEVDLDVPESLPPGDGTYNVTVSHPSGAKSSSKGTLRVFAKETVDNEPTDGARRGRRGRVAVDEDDEVAALAAEAGDDGDENRDVVRRADRYEDDDFDFDSIEEEEEEEKEPDSDEDDEFDTDSDEDEDDEFDFDEDEDEDDEFDTDSDEDEADSDEDDRRAEEAARRKRDDDQRKRAEADKRRKSENRKKADSDQRRKDDERRKAEDDQRRKDEERSRAEAEKRRKADAERKRAAEEEGDDLDFDAEDMEFDDEDLAVEEPPRKKKAEPEAADDFDWDNLPETVFFEDEEEEVLMWAESDGVGVVRIYGDAALDRMGSFYRQFEKGYANGAPEWLWLCYEGDKKPVIRFFRYSTKEGDWVLVHQSPIKFGSADEKKAAFDLMKAVFEGFVPERKKKVPFGRL